MKIYSMTATFGKLSHETLTLEPGLNVIHAPNEWGKSTWCAFLCAMLYGIDTRERTSQTSLADKERYAPWSGEPMSGKIDLCWNGKDITIERRTKGRSIFGDFRAYETESGLDVPELTGENCGQLLLGVEKSVFTRSAFIRLTDMPVTQDEALRRRLNALVTTGDESNAADDLAQKLKDLKNKCRHNKTGLLPQAENQRDGLKQKLEQLHNLQNQIQQIQEKQCALQQQIRLLENHRDALAYEASREDARKVEMAKEAQEQAAAALAQLETECDQLPTREQAEEAIVQLEQLRMQKEALQAETIPTPPEKPEVPAPFIGMTPETALQRATADKNTYDLLTKPTSPLLLILGCLCAVAALAMLFVLFPVAIPLALLAVLFLVLHFGKKRRQQQELQQLCTRYDQLSAENWIPAAEKHVAETAEYNRCLAQLQAQADNLQARKDALEENAEQFTFGGSISECIDGWRETLAAHDSLRTAQQAYYQAKTFAESLAAVAKVAQPAQFPDELTCSAEETRQHLTELALERQQLERHLGQCQGQMETLGQEEALTQQLSAVQARIVRLEDTYQGLTLALQTLTAASEELQRRFAPRIAQRAQALFHKLTGNRYDRLQLAQDLSLHAGAAGEDTIRGAMWRSDGTIDQLYLALRVAVAEELMPHAPLVLDDALVRFDDDRLALALEILGQAAEERQILLFSCHQRESGLCQRFLP